MPRFRLSLADSGKLERSAVLSALFLLAFCLVALPAHSQALTRAPGATVTTVTPHPGFFTEPSIAINPRNPQQVVAAFQDNAHIAYTRDGGRHWHLATGIAPPNFRVSGDVSVAYDPQGHAFICYMAFDKLGTFNYWGHNSSRNGLFIRRSLDGGKTWEVHDIPVIQQPNKSTVPWEDKPYIVADDSHGPHSGTLYIGWTRWTLTGSLILLTRSTNDGKTWSKPIEIDNGPGLPRDDNGALEGFDGVVGPHSTLYAVWTNGTHIVFTDSHDGGRTFTRARQIIRTAPPMFDVQGVARANGFPQISMNPHTGRLFVTWSSYRYGEVDVFCSTSSNHGRTWSRPVKVNNDPVHDGVAHFFQWLAVDPVTGDAYVLFYDRREDPTNRKQIVVLARSTDGGRTFRNYAWTNQQFNAEGVFLGDYTGLAARDGRVYGVWTVKPPVPGSSARGFGRGRRVPRNSREYWRLRGTEIQIGAADFPPSGKATSGGK